MTPDQNYQNEKGGDKIAFAIETSVKNEQISVLVSVTPGGLYEMVKKPFNGNVDALQFPSGGIKQKEDSKSAAFKAIAKGDVFNTPVLVKGPLKYKDEHGEKEVFIYAGVGDSYPKQAKLPVEYMFEEEIKDSSNVTDLHKFVLAEYLNIPKDLNLN